MIKEFTVFRVLPFIFWRYCTTNCPTSHCSIMAFRTKPNSLVSNDRDQFVRLCGRRWVRQAGSAHAQEHDRRGVIPVSLKTASQEVARLKSDALEKADDLYSSGVADGIAAETAFERYQAAKKRAQALGFDYLTTDRISGQRFWACQRRAMPLPTISTDRSSISSVMGPPGTFGSWTGRTLNWLGRIDGKRGAKPRLPLTSRSVSTTTLRTPCVWEAHAGGTAATYAEGVAVASHVLLLIPWSGMEALSVPEVQADTVGSPWAVHAFIEPR